MASLYRMVKEMPEKIIREGWMTRHPTRDTMVHVVNAAYCDQLESEIDELRVELAALRHKQSALLFDPATGKRMTAPVSANEYRRMEGEVAWLYNPWTGDKRDPRDVGTDVLGLLIVQT